VFNEKIDFEHDDDLVIVVDIIDENNNEVVGSLPLNTETYCVSQEHRVFALAVTDGKGRVIGTFNIGAKFKYVGEDADTDTLSLTNDEVSLLSRAFKNLASGQDTLSASLLDNTIEDLELSDGNMI